MKPGMTRLSVLGAAVFAHSALLGAPAHSASLDGTWSGSGYVQPAQGKRERVRCRVSYSRQSSKVYGVRANCASSSNSIRQTGEVLRIRPNYFAGDFYNRQFDIGGRIRVKVRGSSQSVTFKGDGIGGRLTLRKR